MDLLQKSRKYLTDLVSKEQTNHESPTFSVDFFGQSIIMADEQGQLIVADTDMSIKAKIPAHDNCIFDTSVSRTRVYSCSGDQTVKEWNPTDFQCTGTFKGHEHTVKSVQVDLQDENRFCSSSRDGVVCLWDRRCQTTKPITLYKVPKVVDIQWNGNTLCTGGSDGLMRFYDIRKKAPVKSVNLFENYKRSFGLSCLVSGNNLVFGSSLCGKIFAVDWTMMDLIHTYSSPSFAIGTFYVKSAVSPCQRHLISGSSNGSAYIWDIDSPWHAPLVLQGHTNEVTGVAWSDGDILCTSSDDLTSRVWKPLRDKQERDKLNGRADVGTVTPESCALVNLEYEPPALKPHVLTSQCTIKQLQHKKRIAKTPKSKSKKHRTLLDYFSSPSKENIKN
ncbi:WD40-repeat-containing domain protein [Gorgonomyces haynaldii]|nr:WD40-repeat-containing domain protein [Gorgonomyces haynaldii]